MIIVLNLFGNEIIVFFNLKNDVVVFLIVIDMVGCIVYIVFFVNMIVGV